MSIKGCGEGIQNPQIYGDGNAAEPGTEGISRPGGFDGGCEIETNSFNRESNPAS